jgi:hypothetical protein
MMTETYASFRKKLVAEKQKTTYDELESRYGANRYYFWKIINLPKYMPPNWFLRKNGVVKRRYPLRRAINLEDPESAAKVIKEKAGREYVEKLISELEKGLNDE